MTCTIEDHHCKLLVLGLNTADSQTSSQDLRSYFTSHGSIEWIQLFTLGSSAVIHFTQSSTVDRLVRQRTGLVGQQSVRLRRFRSDDTNWHLDSCTLYVKVNRLVRSTGAALAEASLQHCFRDYRTYVRRWDVIDSERALISFCDYDHVDRILLEPANGWMIDEEVPTLERLMTRPIKQSRWDQRATPSLSLPVLAERNPVVHQLITHIEYLARQLREQPALCRKEIERLEAEVFILKNENAQLKSKEKLLSTKNVEKRLTALEDISNRLVRVPCHHQRRERSRSPAQQHNKRRRPCPVNVEQADLP